MSPPVNMRVFKVPLNEMGAAQVDVAKADKFPMGHQERLLHMKSAAQHLRAAAKAIEDNVVAEERMNAGAERSGLYQLDFAGNATPVLLP